VEVVLAGHTHGGQVRWPGIGCVWAHDSIGRRYAWGLHRVRGCLLHVTAGVGVTGPIRARVNCPPEIAVLVLRRGVGGAEVAPGRQVLR
jgi:predicted MPP superfamily phosphohydrolase